MTAREDIRALLHEAAAAVSRNSAKMDFGDFQIASEALRSALDALAAERDALPSEPSEAAALKPRERDAHALRWAVSLLEIHDGVRVNPNSQMWLARLRDLTERTEACAICGVLHLEGERHYEALNRMAAERAGRAGDSA